MTGRSYRLTPLAEVDLENIWRYTFETWSVEQADSYLTDLVAAFEQLAWGEKRGQIVDVRPGYFKHMCGSHIIYFRRMAIGAKLFAFSTPGRMRHGTSRTANGRSPLSARFRMGIAPASRVERRDIMAFTQALSRTMSQRDPVKCPLKSR